MELLQYIEKYTKPLTTHGVAIAVGPANRRQLRKDSNGFFNLRVIGRLGKIQFPSLKTPALPTRDSWLMERVSMQGESFADHFFDTLGGLGIEPGDPFGLYPHVYVGRELDRGYYLENCKISNISVLADFNAQCAGVEIMSGTCENVIKFMHDKPNE